jgi:hypothetical protein
MFFGGGGGGLRIPHNRTEWLALAVAIVLVVWLVRKWMDAG